MKSLRLPCLLVDYLSEAQKKGYILVDNRMAMDAGWNEQLGERFNIREIAFDRWGAVQMVPNLEGMVLTNVRKMI